MRPLKDYRLTLPLFLLLLSLLSGCQLLNAATNQSSCVDHGEGYQDVVAQEGLLSASVEETEAYPMALVLSQDAVNELFAAVSSADLPPIPLAAEPIPGIPVKVTIHPELPLIQIGGELCPTCLLTEMGFGLSFDVAGLEASGSGAGRYQFPLLMNGTGLEPTAVVAQLGQSEVLSLDLHVNGVDDTIVNFFEPLIADAVTYLIRNDYGDTELFQIKPWQIGDGDVKLVGRGPHLSPENRTLVIGMHSNLLRPEATSIEWQPTLPEGADVGLQLHPGLVQSMISRMMTEGHIARSYSASGEAEENGEHQVTLNSMSARDDGMLGTSFRLWRTAGGFCGFADLDASMGLSISDKQLRFAVQDVTIGETAGAGDLLQYANSWMGSDYLNQLVSYSELTVNYNELEIPGDKRADMSAESFRLDLGGQGLSLFLNIDAIVDAATE